MSMGLGCAAMLPRVEEGEKAPLLAVACALLPLLQASIGRLQVILLEHMRLLLIRLGGEDEVFGYDGEFVQYEDVGGVPGGDVCNAECFWRVFERINLLLRRGTWEIW